MMQFRDYSDVRSSGVSFIGSVVRMLALAGAFIAVTSSAQQLTGTISGTAYDQSGAVVPKANVVLKNESSGDQRTSVTQSDGHFVIVAVQPGSYSIVVSAPGFSSWQENGIVMSTGDSREVPNIKLTVGGNSTEINVVSGTDAIVPTDTAEISTTINQQMINDFPLAGRDAGELLKILPGMAFNNGGNQNGSNQFTDRIVSSNNGPAGTFSSNGTQPYGTMAFMLDGANLVDPGNDGSQIANINADMVGSVKVLVSNYGAEYAKGPVIFQAFSRSGGAQFHGEGYLYTHNGTLNSVDAYTKSQGPAAVAAATAPQSYYYMGGNVGGPIILPWIKFNRDRKKLFFWGGYEYMKQQPAGSVLNYNVPNDAQKAGDFSNTASCLACTVSQATINQWGQFYSALNTSNVPAGGTATSVPVSSFDPDFLGILKLYPEVNETPSANNGYSNYNYVNTSPQNRWEATGKVDYAISDNDKLTGSYTFQQENDLAPISIWWAEPQTLPYPSSAASKTQTYVILSNYTHVFNPTTTNEFVFTWSHFKNPYALSDPSKVDRQKNGFNVNGMFGHTTAQIPNFEPGYCCSGALASFNYFSINGTWGGLKQVPAFYDNVTKIVGNHTLKAGFYWDQVQNANNSSAADNGTYAFETWTGLSTGNFVADEVLGHVQSYSQQNYNPYVSTKWHQWSIYGQDSFKASKSLTINVGLRADHIGQWYGTDFNVWNPATYVNSTNANAYPNTGISWHANDPSIPVSGFPSRLFFYAPRLGLAYDIFGTGKTVFRGGIGTYYYQATAPGATGIPLGSFNFTTPNPYNGFATINNPPAGDTNFTPPSSVAANGGAVSGLQIGDSRVPFTTNWNVTISQALPWRSVLEVSYIGNRSANEYLDGSNGNLFNLNNVHPGAFFGADPVLGFAVSPNAPPCSATPSSGDSLYCLGNRQAYSATFQVNDYRPLVAYTNVFLLTHASYAKYNGFQAQFQKQSGALTFIANYTFSKVLGTRDGNSSNGPGNGTALDPYILRNNYGPLAYDHTQIVNFTYNWALPSKIHGDSLGMKLAGGALNGWKLSGYTAWQSGAPISPGFANFTPNNLTVPTVANPDLPDNSFVLKSGLRAVSVNAQTYLGSNAYGALLPALTCDPRKGLHLSGQRYNPACYTTPAYGQQGPTNPPYIRYNPYFDTDLGIYKSFRVTEGQSIQFRASATNWINHPLRQFGLANSSDETLMFEQSSPATCTGCAGQTVYSLSPTNTNATTTGVPAFKDGSRFVTLALKYYF